MNKQENFTNYEDDSIDIVKEIRYYTFFWPWFLASIIILLLSAFMYLRYTNTIYKSNATLQVKDASSDPSSFLTQSVGAMFSFNKVKLDNHIAQITSQPNLKNVVEALDLRTNVFLEGRVKSSLKYGNEIPFSIEFKTDVIYEDAIRLEFENKKLSVELNNKRFKLGSSKTFDHEDFILTINQVPDLDCKYLITRISELDVVANLSAGIIIESSSEEGDNIDISIMGPNVKRNEAIINSLIQVAHEDQIKEKSKVYLLSIDFINTRLSSIVSEIDSLSLKTTGFKSDNLIFSPEIQ